MDFKTLVPGVAGLAGVATDALLVVVHGKPQAAAVATALGAELAALLKEAEKSGDFVSRFVTCFLVTRRNSAIWPVSSRSVGAGVLTRLLPVRRQQQARHHQR